MKNIILLVLVSAVFLQCKKVPEQDIPIIKPISFNGQPLLEGQGIEINYGTEADAVFDFSTESELEYAYIKITPPSINEVGISDSDDENITNHPKEGDKEGTFTYTIKTLSQFDPPIGNPVVDRKALRIIMMNKLGTVKEFTISITVK